MQVAPVLLLQHGLGALYYRLPEGTPAGTVVEAPLGPRRVAGVVWDDGLFPSRPVPAEKLRDAVPLDVPPIARSLRALIAWVADYYLAPPAAVLRMALPQAAFLPAPHVPVYALGALPAAVRHKGRRALIDRLAALDSLGPAPLAVWAAAADVPVARLRPLVKAGLLVESAGDPDAALPALPPLPPGPALSPAQEEVAATLRAAVRAQHFQPYLLDGVTGSGKTEVYFDSIAAALEDGGQALVLLPEIALTESWLARFETRFAFAPTLWHSGLTSSARRRAFADLADGRARVVVGARSALFLPHARLRLIVVDEAHDAAFKQEESVPYHGRDTGVMRARFEDIPILLSTATPGLETREQVARGTYRPLHLPDRHGGARMPRSHLVDLTRTPPPRGRWIAPPVAEAIDRRLKEKAQSLLFLNRRGYAPLTLCRACGERIQCPNCTAWLVEHRLARRLMCHHCGHSIPVPPACPACGAEDSLAPCGPGVERLAEEVAARWPTARTAIVTSDTIRTRADMAGLVADVAAGRLDILVGTQMMAKGHDFRGLTLVAVIDADLGLEGGDPRAAERVWQQIVQVGGRAGRGTRPGELFIQTHQPGARIMQALARGDPAAFHDADRAQRQAAGMPPFGRLAALIVSATDRHAAEAAARALGSAAPAAPGISVSGPAPAPLAMLRGRHRHRLLVRADRNAPLQDMLRAWLAAVKLPAGVRVSVDVDPQSFL